MREWDAIARLRHQARELEDRVQAVPLRTPPGGGGGGAGALTQFVVDEVHDDYLLCHKGTYGTPLGGLSQFPVALPFMLLNAPFDEETITYPKPASTDVYYEHYSSEGSQSRFAYLNHGEADEYYEIQLITPPYFIGEEIRAVQGATGITVTINEVETALVWQDINTAGRAWAVIPDQYAE